MTFYVIKLWYFLREEEEGKSAEQRKSVKSHHVVVYFFFPFEIITMRTKSFDYETIHVVDVEISGQQVWLFIMKFQIINGI